jgi:hypothetical protein
MANGLGHTDLTWHTALSCNGGTCVMVAASGQTVFLVVPKSLYCMFLFHALAECR